MLFSTRLLGHLFATDEGGTGGAATDTTAQTAGEAGSSTNAVATGGTTATQNAGSDKKFSQAELDDLIEKRLAREKKAREREAEEAEAKRKGDFEKLLAARNQELAEAKAEAAAEKLARLRQEVALKHELPANLAKRLQGTTEAELEADAAELAKDLPKPAPANGGNPANPASDRGGRQTAAALDFKHPPSWSDAFRTPST